jgi:hypothetical protein
MSTRSVTARHLMSARSADSPPPPLHVHHPKRALILLASRPSITCFLLLAKQPSEPRHRLCSPHHSPLLLLHPTLTPSSAQATPLSKSTIFKRRFCLEPTAMRSPRSLPTSCVISAEGTSLIAAISSHRPPPVSPPRGSHQRPDPLLPASRCRRPRVRTTATVPLRLTHATVDSTPDELPSSQPSPNWFTKPPWSSSRCFPAGLVADEPELAGRRRPVPSAHLLFSGWASHQNGWPTRWARLSHQKKRPKCTVHFYLFQSICLNQIQIVQTF